MRRFGLHLDPPVMQFDEVAREREAQPGPALARATAVFGLVELVEDPLQLVGRDAVVFHRHALITVTVEEFGSRFRRLTVYRE